MRGYDTSSRLKPSSRTVIHGTGEHTGPKIHNSFYPIGDFSAHPLGLLCSVPGTHEYRGAKELTASSEALTNHTKLEIARTCTTEPALGIRYSIVLRTPRRLAKSIAQTLFELNLG